ncbi:MAG: DUF4923 family protein [Prevotella sp.]|nr:DUF4923 family protein [Prevotella sp.]
MKKFFRLTAMCFMLLFVNGASAQIDLGGLLGGMLGGSSSSSSNSSGSSTNDLISGLTSIFSSKKQASEKSIVGTWVYAEPAIVLKSDNILSNVAAKVAAGKIEDKLAGVLSKYGIKEGMLSITFNEDGTFTETIGKKTIKGKWTVKDSKLNLTFGTLKPKTIPITTQLEGSQLLFVTDASKLLDFVKNIGSKSSNSNIKTITKLMDNVTGMQAGLTMKKK